MKQKFDNFVELLHHRAEIQANKTIFTFLADGETEGTYLTYQQLDQQARAIASQLQSINGKGQRALLLYQPGLEFITAFLGCLYAGVVAVPAYPPRANRSLERLQAIVNDAQAHFALTTEGLVSSIEGKLTEVIGQETKTVQCLTTDTIDLDLGANWYRPDLSGEQLAFLQYTSGSTGNPKGVMVSHGNLMHNSWLINQCFRDTCESEAVSWLPPYHDMGLIGGILQPIYVGVSMTIMPPVTFLQRPVRWLEAISKRRVTTSGAPNFAYQLCVDTVTPKQMESLDLSCWKLAFSGAEPVRAQTLERFANKFARCGFDKRAFYPCYGMAETTLIVSGGFKDEEPVLRSFDGKGIERNQVIPVDASEAHSVTIVGCGHAVEGERFVIVNPYTLQVCSQDTIGEIWVQSESVAQGYWNRPDLTEITFNAYIADTQEGPFLRTGDLGFIQDRELFITGRLKDLIVIRGRNYYPQDIEHTVELSHPAIREGCGAAFSVELEGDERLVITYEVKRSYVRKLNVEEVTAAIRKAIIDNFELQVYAIVLLKTGSIPKTSSGKIQRHACKAEFLAGSLNSVGQWQQDLSVLDAKIKKDDKNIITLEQNPIQDWLVNNIAKKLGISPEEIDVTEPFVSYGLDSVSAVRLSAELEDWLRLKLSPTLVYDYPTIASLSGYLSDLSKLNLEKQENLTDSTQKVITSKESIAIIGLGCRFPKARNVQEFWDLLRSGKDGISRDKVRWGGKVWGGFLDDVDGFDAAFFGISPREAEEMDPQQRLLLEVSWEALENAGLATEKLKGSSTGVFIGISSYDYAQVRLKSQLEPSAYVGTGNAHSIAANRLSYWFDLHGPSLSVDTACSSSLVALHLAVRSLQLGECEQAIAGGVNVLLSAELTETFTLAGMMSPDGRCKTFDEKADGYVRGEGCGVVILKRLEDALRDGDPILAVVLGSAINQDGRSNGLTAPNGLSQQRVIRQALSNAGVSGQDISYVETHGTGTTLGDPIEVNSLKAVLLEGRDQPLWLGSVKTNIGHLEAAAGIAGLIKVVLSLQHQTIPPNLHLNTLNPLIDLQEPLTIPTQLTEWRLGEEGQGSVGSVGSVGGNIPLTPPSLPHHPTPPHPPSSKRLAGVSSFGFGGTNAHVIVEEFIRVAPISSIPTRERPLHLFTLSAKTETALYKLVKLYENYLISHPDVNLSDLCFTANTGRYNFKHRLGVIASSSEQLQERLSSLSEGTFTGSFDKGVSNKIAFLFTGQGSQYVGMGKGLYETQPTFKDALDKCAELLQPYLDKPLLDVLYLGVRSQESGVRRESGVDSFENETALSRMKMDNISGSMSQMIDQTVYTQPALFALEYALCEMWLSWGIEPSVMMGHSVGEYVAATVAGVFSLEDGIKLIAHRAKLMQELPKNGMMAAVRCDEETLQNAILSEIDKVSIAAVNGPDSVVISGEGTAVTRVIESLESQGIKTKRLQVSHAFHSPLMQPMLEKFEEIASQVSYNLPRIPIVSNVTGDIAGEEIITPQYWVNHVINTVKFAQGIEKLKQQGYQVFLEVGAKPTLLGMAREILSKEEQEYLFLPSLRQGKENWEEILSSLARLYVSGFDINSQNFDQDYQRNKVYGLPNYPFERQGYWFGPFSGINVETKHDKSLQQETELYQVVWKAKPYIVQTPTIGKQWLIFADEDGLGSQLERELEKQGMRVIIVYPGEGYFKENDTTTYRVNPTHKQDFISLLQDSKTSIPELDGVIYLWGLNKSEVMDNISTEGVLYLLQAMSEQSLSARLWIVTRGTLDMLKVKSQKSKVKSFGNVISYQNEDKMEQIPLNGVLWGLGKVLALEYPEYWGGLMDLAPQKETRETQFILDQVCYPDGESYVTFRDGVRYVARLEKSANIDLSTLNPYKISQEGTYLITGGLGAVGVHVAQWLVKQGAKYLVLIGRSEPSDKVRETLTSLEQQGVNLVILRADVAKIGEMEEVFNKIKTSLPPLKGVIHAAGVLDDGLLAGMSWERFKRVLTPKVQGTWNLHELTKDIPLDFFVMFSSAASLLGSPGQGNYAAANGFLDAIACYRHSLGLPALSVNWGPLSVGMASEKRLGTKGLNVIDMDQGLDMLGRLINADVSSVGVLSVNWEMLGQQFPYIIESSYFEEVRPFTDISRENEQGLEQVIFAELVKMTGKEREEYLTRYLRASIARIMHIEEDKISPSDSLLELGMDSLMVMEAINQVKGDLRLMLYPREFYERPKIEALAKYIAAEFTKTHGENVTIITPNKNLEVGQVGSIHHITPLSLPDGFGKLPGMVFILSSPRSGSTLLRVMLAGHRDLVCPPELHLLPFNSMGQRESELGLSHLGEGLQRAFMELKGLDAAESQKLIQQLVNEDISIPDVYKMLLCLAGKRLLIDKSPTYSIQREILERSQVIFEGAKYVHLIRHPYPVIDSFCRLRMDKLVGSGNDNPYQLAESIWRQSNENIIEFSKGLNKDSYIQVRYEDLVTQPEQIMRNLCEFLGVQFDESVLDPYSGNRMTDGIYSQSMSVGDPNFSKRSKIDAKLADVWKDIQLPQPLGEDTRSLAVSFNYQVPHSKPIFPMEETYINVRGLNICLCSWGSEEGELVLCLHGILEQGAAWGEVANYMVQKGYRVVAPDLRGHGKSDLMGVGGSYNLLDFLGDVDAIVATLTDKPVTLVGHSMGSIIAAMFASIRPGKVKNLILVETVLPTEVKEDETVEQLATHLNYLMAPPEHPVFSDVNVAAKRLKMATPSMSETLAMQLAERITEPCDGGVRWRWDSLLRTRAGIEFNGINKSRYVSLLKQIKTPITLIYGEQSDFNRPEDLAEQEQAMSQAERIVIQGGHNLHLDAAVELSKIISRVVQESC